jgi:DeoR/GlpR family transcriptional regulator of sugar metabolism
MIGAIRRKFTETCVDKAFIGIGGIDLLDGLTEYNLEDAQTKQVLIRAPGRKSLSPMAANSD